MAHFVKVPKMGMIEVNEANKPLLVKLGLIKEDKPKKKKKDDTAQEGLRQHDSLDIDGAIDSPAAE
jgi:DNA-directed RNA polymerase subunit H (RpoH/RPB5)